ncbi:MAG: sigma-70 family RNA polymerase sigma factor [Actinomycetota bacterium]|nr:sigma-70 family RNA polymerase sigma factor [Actinomycetota bacterium]
MEHARGGSQAAWDELVRRFGGLVAAIARRHRLGQADAADVAQLTWLQLHRHVHRLSRPASVGGWIARTARNECLRTLDRKARELPVDPATVGDDGASAGADPLGAVLTAERAEIVRRAVAELPDRSQELIELLFWQQGTYFEVTDSLGMPRGSIGPVRGRCLRRLAARSDVAALA